MIIVCIAGILFQSSTTDPQQMQMGMIGAREGLTNAHIRDIEQDGDGFVWVGTEGGLFHLTGDRCRRFDEKMLGLDGCNIGSLCYDSVTNVLWIATLQSGISCYDCTRRTFSHLTVDDGLLSNMIAGVANSADGGVWIFHHRGMIQQWRDGQLTTFLDSGLPDVIRSGVDDGKGALFIGHRSSGVTRINVATREISRDVDVTYLPGTTPGQNVYNFEVEPSGRVVCHPRNDVSLVDRDGNEWSLLVGRGLQVRYHSGSFYRLRSFDGEYDIADNCISSVIQSSDGSLWMGGANLLIHSTDDGVILDTINFLKPLGVDNATVRALHFDRDGKLLVGLRSHSLLEYDLSKKTLRHIDIADHGIDVNDIIETSSGVLMLATESGLYRRSVDGQYQIDERRNAQLRSCLIRSFDLDADGNLWLGTIGGGVSVLRSNGELLTNISAQEGLLSDNVSQLVCDRDRNEVWIATHKGLAHVFDSRHPERFEILDEQQGLPDAMVNAVLVDRFGQVWLSTSAGISALDVAHHRFINYNYEDGIPEGMYCEGAGRTLLDGRISLGSFSGCAIVNPKDGARSNRIPVQTLNLRFPTPWYLSVFMLCLYVAVVIVVIVLVLSRYFQTSKEEAVQTERVLQQVAPVNVGMSDADREFLDRIARYIEANLQSDSLDVASIAQEMAMSHSAFYRKVKLLTGCTSAEFIRKIKLRKSRQLLEEGSLSVHKVAMLTGFNSMSNFREAFKKEFNMLPSDVGNSSKNN